MIVRIANREDPGLNASLKKDLILDCAVRQGLCDKCSTILNTSLKCVLK